MINGFKPFQPFDLGALAFGKSEIQKAVDVLRSFGTNAHVYLPGIGMLNGLQAGNYIENAGLSVGVVDQPVGLVLDAGGSVGPELITDTGFDNSSSWTLVQPVSGVVSVIGGKLSILSIDGSYCAVYAATPMVITAGATYFYSLTVDSISGGRGVAVEIGGAASSRFDTAGVKTGYITAIGSGKPTVKLGGATANSGAIIDNISIREVTGIHATQATTGYKPILRRGAVNMLTYSQDLTNAAWTKSDGSGCTVIGGVAAPNGSASANKFTAATATSAACMIIVKTLAVTLGSTYTASVYLQKAELGYAHLVFIAGFPTTALSINLTSGVISVSNGVGTPLTPLCTDAGNGWWRVSFSAVAASTTSIGQLAVYTSQDGLWASRTDLKVIGQGIHIFGVQLEVGNSASNYSPTTTVPASNPNAGNYALEFDGVNDLISLGAPLFQVADDHCVIAAASPFQTNVDCDVFGQRNTSNTSALLPLVRFGADGKLRALYRDDAGTFNAAQVLQNYVANTAQVVSCRRVGALIGLRLNAGSVAPAAYTLGVTTANTSTIGAGVTTNALGMFKGSIGPVIVINGTVSDANLLLLEKLVASLSGVTI